VDIKAPGGLGNNGWNFIEPPPVQVPPAMPMPPALAPGPQLTPGGVLTGASVILFFGALFSGDAPLVTIGPDGIPSNKTGQTYPDWLDPRTGQPVAFPPPPLTVVPLEKRTPYDSSYDRAKFIKEWHDRGYARPPGGWAGTNVQVHHIKPLELGGTNDFWNMVPLPIDVHKVFTRYWRSY
jgi:hypothetical protein